MALPSNGAVFKIRNLFIEKNNSLTSVDIKRFLPDLMQSDISMALCYLNQQRYVTREKTKNPKEKGRKELWIYTYSLTKLPKENENRTNQP